MQNLNQFKKTLDNMTPVVLSDGITTREQRVVQVTYDEDKVHYDDLLTQLKAKFADQYDDVIIKTMIDDMESGDLRHVRGLRRSSKNGFRPETMANWIATEGEIRSDDS